MTAPPATPRPWRPATRIAFLRISDLLSRLGFSAPAHTLWYRFILPLSIAALIAITALSWFFAHAAAPALSRDFPTLPGAPSLDGVYFLAVFAALGAFVDLAATTTHIFVAPSAQRIAALRSWHIVGIGTTAALLHSHMLPVGLRAALLWSPLLTLTATTLGTPAQHRLVLLLTLLGLVLHLFDTLHEAGVLRTLRTHRTPAWPWILTRLAGWCLASAALMGLAVNAIATLVHAASAGASASSLSELHIPAAPILEQLGQPSTAWPLAAALGTVCLGAGGLLVRILLDDQPLLCHRLPRTTPTPPHAGVLSPRLYPIVSDTSLRLIASSPTVIGFAILSGASLALGLTLPSSMSASAFPAGRTLWVGIATVSLGCLFPHLELVSLHRNRLRYRTHYEHLATTAPLLRRLACSTLLITSPSILLLWASIPLLAHLDSTPTQLICLTVGLPLLIPAAFLCADGVASRFPDGKGFAEIVEGLLASLLTLVAAVIFGAYPAAALVIIPALWALGLGLIHERILRRC